MSCLYVYDVTTNQSLNLTLGSFNGWQLHATGSINGVAGLPNERAVSASDDKTIKVWNLAGAVSLYGSLRVQCLHTLRGHRSSVLCVAALPRDRIVSGSRDKTLKVWDVTHGLCLQTLGGHTGWVPVGGLPTAGSTGSRDKTPRGFTGPPIVGASRPVAPAGGVVVVFFFAGSSRRRRFVETDSVARRVRPGRGEAGRRLRAARGFPSGTSHRLRDTAQGCGRGRRGGGDQICRSGRPCRMPRVGSAVPQLGGLALSKSNLHILLHVLRLLHGPVAVGLLRRDVLFRAPQRVI